jgi:predicted phage terminase large subunit-like protein
MTGGVMGDGGDTVLLDDPHDRQGAHSEAEREAALTTYDEAIITRLNDPKSSAIVIIMQRLHHNDLSGHVLKNKGEWEHLMLPMRFEVARRSVTSLGFRDTRTYEGELLWPERFPEEVVASLEITLGTYGTAGQLQQRPSPAGGGILKTDRFRLWPADKDLPDLFFIVQSYDTAFTEKTSGDPTGCEVWGVFEHEKKRRVLLLDCWNERLGYPALKQRVMEDWQARYGGVKNNLVKPSRKADIVLVEAKGSGQSLLQDLHLSNIPAVPYNPGKADKVARAHMASPLLESDIFWVLESTKHKGRPRTWVQPFLDQLEQFPAGEHDEMVDCFTQVVIYLRDAGQLEVAVAPRDEPEEVDYEYKKRIRVNPYG